MLSYYIKKHTNMKLVHKPLVKAIAAALLAGSAAISAGAWAASCAEWNLAKDFQVFPNQENPNPDSCGNPDVWYFMESIDFNRDPAGYSLMQEFTTDLAGIHNLQGWGGTERDYGFVNGYLPQVSKNETGGELIGTTMNKVGIHPGWTKLVVVGWHSPINGSVAITGSIVDTNNSCGDGVMWFIDKNDTNLASGSFAEGGSQSLQDDVTISNAVSNIPVNQGDFIYFVVNPNGSTYCDSTALDITIKPIGTAACQHAVYDTETQKVTIPFIDIPLLDLWTGAETGEIGVFSGELEKVKGVEDFTIASFDYVSLATGYDECHARYTYNDGIYGNGGELTLPYIDVQSVIIVPPNNRIAGPTRVYNATLRQLAIDNDVFHLRDYTYLETIQ